MKKTFQSSGIILRTQPLGELDRFVIFYTPDRGKITCIAKGIRTLKSKRGGHIEVMNRVNAQFWKNQHHTYLRECRIEERFLELKNDMSPLCSALFILEALERLTAEEHPHPELFTLLDETLMLMNQHCSRHEIIREIVLVKMLHLLGVMGSFRQCGSCHQHLPLKTAYLKRSSGILLCETCCTPGNPYDIENIALPQLKLMNFIRSNRLPSILKINLDRSHHHFLTELGRTFLSKQLAQPLRSEKALGMYV